MFAEASAGQRHLTVVVPARRPVASVMQAISRVLGMDWERSWPAPHPVWWLRANEAASGRAAEASLLAREQTRQRLQARLDEVFALLDPDDPPQEQGNPGDEWRYGCGVHAVWFVAPQWRAAIRLLGGLTAAQIDSLLSGQEIQVAFDSLSSGMKEEVYRYYGGRGARTMAKPSHVDEPAPLGDADPPPGSAWKVIWDIKRLEGEFIYFRLIPDPVEPNIELCSSSRGYGAESFQKNELLLVYPRGNRLEDDDWPRVPDCEEPEALPDRERLAPSDPVFDTQITLQPGAWNQILRQIAAKTGLPIAADWHRTLAGDPGAVMPTYREIVLTKPIKDLPLAEALDQLCEKFDYTWSFEDGWLLFRWKYGYLGEEPPPLPASHLPSSEHGPK